MYDGQKDCLSDALEYPDTRPLHQMRFAGRPQESDLVLQLA